MPEAIGHLQASMKIDEARIRWFRLRRSGLVTPFPSPVHAAKALVGVQAQILPAAGLALFNRCPRMSDAYLDELLHNTRSLVKIWGQRGTLHLFASEDWPFMISASSRRLSNWEEESTPFGLPRGQYREMLVEVEQLLKRSATLGRKGLLESGLPLHNSCYSPWGGIYTDLVLRGLACHVRRTGGEGRFAHRHNWLPDLEWSTPSHEAASGELVRRYARTYGPVNPRDLAFWGGMKVTDARRWLRELDGEMGTVETGQGDFRCMRQDMAELQEEPPPPGHWPLIMLYRFDPLLLGYRNREWVLDDRFKDQVSRAAGHIEGTILDPLDGMICGTWRYARAAGGLSVGISPFRAMQPTLKRAIKARARDIAGYFGLPLKEIAFSRPITK